MVEKSRFNIKFDKILQILCKEIYDSPLSMLRENVQNAYDAILIRKKYDPSMAEGHIIVTIDGKCITVSDNGIGMTQENLNKNYWTAGASGKNNDYAKAAGVVGTFGIGAMANFGVCQQLKVITRYVDSPDTITSWVDKESLSNEEECIQTEFNQDRLDEPGTTVIVELDNEHNISADDAINYLTPFVRYLQIPLLINGNLISCQSYRLPEVSQSEESVEGEFKSPAGLQFHYRILLNKNTFVNPRIEMTEIKSPSYKYAIGDVVLNSTENTIFGLRNGFGLSPINVPSTFNLGGVANLLNLFPTAGRDAVLRQSMDFVIRLIIYADELVAKAIAQSEMADYSRELIQYIKSHSAYSLADNIQIGIANSDERISLGKLQSVIDSKRVMFYSGSDKSIVSSYEDRDSIVLIPSNDRVRRAVQITVLKLRHIPEISDTPIASGIIDNKSLTSEELSILYKIKSVIEDDYLVPDCKVDFATISHGLSILVNREEKYLHIYLSRGSTDLDTLKRIYKDNYGLFEPFVKDFVRTRLYSKISPYIPSSQKEGADALYEMLQRKKELYTIETSDYGNMDYLLNEYLSGRAKIEDVFRAVNRDKNKQRQTLDSGNVGNAHDILGGETLPASPNPNEQEATEYDALPPIMRLDTITEYKILQTESGGSIEGYSSFLALSEKMDHDFRDFFFHPHTTRVIWSMHKIIYVFTHVSGNLTLYYEMELKKKLSDNATGGRTIKSATIITGNRIFVPIISDFHNYFDIKSGKLTFLVRYDSVKS